jgi:hypothetical protein
MSAQQLTFGLLHARPQEILAFRENVWPCQATFVTPLKELGRFVGTLLDTISLESAVLSTDVVVFEPKGLVGLLSCNSIQVHNQWDFNLRATGQRAISELLHAALSDWADFALVPSPPLFAIYADHDEYITFYTRSPLDLEVLKSRLTTANFKFVDGYIRPKKEYSNTRLATSSD